MCKIKKLKEKRAAIHQEGEALMSSITEERGFTPEESTQFADIERRFKEVDEEISILEQAEKRSMKLAEPSNKAGYRGRVDTSEYDKEARAAFFAYITGRDTPEQRAAIAGVDGHVLVPTSISDQIELGIRERGDFLGAATTYNTTTGGDFVIPMLNTSDMRAKTMKEYEKSTEEDTTIGSIKLGAHTFRTSIFTLSYEQLQDSSQNVEAIIIAALVESIWAGLNYDCTVGDGIDKPKGIIVDCDKGAVAESSLSVSYMDLVNLRKSVTRAYSKKGVASFMMNQNTQVELMKIRDTTGRPIFVESPIEGEPDKLLGYPVVINEDMEDIGPDAKSIAFGSLKKYALRIAKGVTIEKFTEAYKAYLSVGFMAFFRADGKLIKSTELSPVKFLQHPTSSTPAAE